jgi:hypothetical protein
MKYSICFSACLLLFGCATLFPIQVTDPRTGIEYTVPARLNDVPGIRELAEACATQAGRVVHRTVEVEGYFSHGTESCDNACWSSFAQSPYQYMEFEVTKTEKWLFLKEKGLWRISKQPDDDPRCGSKPTQYVKRISERDGWPVDFCLAFERIDEVKSQYETAWEGEVLHDDIEGVDKISLSIMQIKDRSTGSVLGFNASPTLFLADYIRSSQRSFNCSSLGVEPPGFEAKSSLLRQVLK